MRAKCYIGKLPSQCDADIKILCLEVERDQFVGQFRFDSVENTQCPALRDSVETDSVTAEFLLRHALCRSSKICSNKMQAKAHTSH